MTKNSIEPLLGDPHIERNVLVFSNNRFLIDLCGVYDKNLAELEQKLSVQILRRGNQLAFYGKTEAIDEAKAILTELYERLEGGLDLEPADLDRAMRKFYCERSKNEKSINSLDNSSVSYIEIKTRKKTIEPRTAGQREYVKRLLNHELSFGIGPAGTGKTYLAVAVAVAKFNSGEVDRIIFSRPAVEAGEKLGYLPGDMKEKVDPYMQPLYDALYDFIPERQLSKLMEEKKIEIAPLAFMRGRTLSHSFVVLDEAQNTTSMQMKMFLTRLGEGSRMVITGDISQIDLPRGTTSGLHEAQKLLENIPDISFSYLTSKDVVRHRLVAAIIKAYADATE